MNNLRLLKKCVTCLVFLAFSIPLFSQGPPILQPGDDTYYEIYNRLDAYYGENTDPIESLENKGVDNFYKWAQYWKFRMDPNGGFGGANQILARDIRDGFEPLCELETDIDEAIEWRNLGPFNSDNTTGQSNFCGGNNMLRVQNQGRLDAISVHPDDPNRILVGGANGGIWKTEDGGGTWRNTTIEEGFTIVGMRDIIRHPVDPNIVYAATGGSIGLWDLNGTFPHNYGIGVIRSLDDGENWHLMPYRDNIYVVNNKVISLAIDPRSTLEETTIYGHAEKGQMLSFSGAAAGMEPWRFVFQDCVDEIEISPGVFIEDNRAWFRAINDVEVMNDGTVLFSARPINFPANNYYVYRLDPGTECPYQLPLFPAPNTVFGNSPACNPDFPNEPKIGLIDIELVDPVPTKPQERIVVMVKYFEITGGNCNGTDNYAVFFHSDDGGATWIGAGQNGEGVAGTDNTTAATRTFGVSKFNPDVLYLNIGTCIQKSIDGGASFSGMNSIESHVDLRFIHVYDGDLTGDPEGLNDQVYIGTDGGISKTEIRAGGEVHLKDITGEGMACTNNFGVGITEKNSDLIFTGAQDGSINFYNEGEWFETNPSGDNGDALIKIEDNGIIRVFQESQDRFHAGNLNAVGTDVTRIPGSVASLPEATRWAPLIHNSDKSEMFAATQGLYTSNNNGLSWTPVIIGADIIALLEPGSTTGPIRLGNLGMSAGDDNVIYFCLASFYYDNSQSVSVVDGNVGAMFKATRDDVNSDWEIELLGIDDNGVKDPILNFSGSGEDISIGAPISDIAVDPEDSDIVWISLGSFVEGQKVLKSEDGGITWENHSGCLPNIPFSSIICQGGASNQIYAGSDFGLYYKDDNLGDWIFYADGPRALISDMEINRCANKIVVATMGLGLWEVDLVKGAPTIIAANTNESWTSDRSLYGDLIVEEGAELIIFNSTISISRLVNIIVEPGGTLILIGSTLTNGCGDLWEGIDVWGDTNQHQFAQGGDYLQGRVEITNSVIEYARTAVKLGRDDDEENLFTGGIVNASNSTFRNNQTGVRFNPYSNTLPVPNSPVFANASTIDDCTFLTNEALPEGLNPIAFISLWGVDEVPIYNNSFSNLLASANTAAELGKGIYSQDASFSVSGCDNTCSTANECCGENGTKFTNLSHGVHAQSGKSMRKFTVDAASFENCNYGVYFTAVNFARITRSEFKFGITPNEAARTYGIVNENSTGFQIEDNLFVGEEAANSTTIGTLMGHTGNDNNRIFNNQFTGLNFANWAVGNNAAPDFSNGTNTGLLYACNTQSESRDYDINVLYGTGIRALQGDFDPISNNFVPARNTFSNSGANAWSDIAVIGGGTNNVNYVYGSGTNEEPLFVTSIKVTTEFAENPTDGCQSSFENPTEKEVKKTRYNETNEIFTIKKQEYEQRIDNGNTEYFFNRLATVGTNNQNLKNEILTVSPYISTGIIEKIVETNKFTQNHLYNILNANPDGLRQSDLLEILPTETSLSQYQLNQLGQRVETITERGEMEYLLTSLKAEKDQYAKELVQLLLLEDRSTATNQEIQEWLEATESIAAAYSKVDLAFETGISTEGLETLAKVPISFTLNEAEAAELADLSTLYQLFYDLPSDSRNEAYFTETEYDLVDELANSGHGKAKAKARNIMQFFYDKIYPLDLPEQANLNEAPAGNNVENAVTVVSFKEELSLVTVSPNPASTTINIRYASPSLYGNTGEISIVNFYGQDFYQGKIKAQEQNISLNVEAWPSGMYYCVYKSTEKKKQLIPFFINH